MRITGGISRGQIIKVPKNYDLRPTTDRIREAIFSMLLNITDMIGRCLDLYAGTGALGIEALSRGADWVDFVEKERRCCDIIKENLNKMSFSQRAHVYCYSVIKALNILNGEYNTVFMDPPYAIENIEVIVNRLAHASYIVNDSLLVISHSSRLALAEQYGSFSLVKNRKHGDTCISIYQKEVNS